MLLIRPAQRARAKKARTWCSMSVNSPNTSAVAFAVDQVYLA